VEIEGIGLEEIDFEVLNGFGAHLSRCHCRQANGGTSGDVARGAKLFLKYLGRSGRLDVADFKEEKAPEPELVRCFKQWLEQHRGLSKSTLDKYGRGAKALIEALGSEPGKYEPQSLRNFLLGCGKGMGPGAAKTLVTALRMFLRYLGQQGKCHVGLERAIPALAGWRHRALPSYLRTGELQRIIEGCEATTIMGIRDRAIILLLARLGLRAGDVAELCLSKIDWKDGSFLVSGKGQYEVRLPLSQEVGDAIVDYLERRPRVDEDRVFLRIVAPYRPLSVRGPWTYPVLVDSELSGIGEQHCLIPNWRFIVGV
jgi:site-specific recombinase XerC